MSSPDGGGFRGVIGGRGEEVLGVGEEVEALVETGVVLVVEGEGVEDSEVEGVGIEEEEVVDLLEVAEEIGAEVDLVEEEAEIVEVLVGAGEETGEVMVGVGVAVVVGQ